MSDTDSDGAQIDEESLARLMELAAEVNVELHPDLVPYVRANGIGGRGLFHPLVFDPMLTMPGLANKQYLYKTERLAEAISAGDFRTAVFLHERPHRLDAYLNIVDFIPPSQRPALVRSIWTDTENAWQSDDEWIEVFESLDDPRSMMTAEETAALAAMPEPLLVYRGAQRGLNENGLSWTPDAELAVWFAQRWAEDRDTDPIVLRGKVSKAAITAYLSSREPEFVLMPYHQPDDVEILAPSSVPLT